jgi:hypothetical protein
MLLHIPQSLLNTLSRMKYFQMLSESSSSFLVPIEHKTDSILMTFTMRTLECFHDNHHNSYAVEGNPSCGNTLTSTAMAASICTHDETIRKVVSSSNKFHWLLNTGGKIGIKPKARTQMLKSI